MTASYYMFGVELVGDGEELVCDVGSEGLVDVFVPVPHGADVKAAGVLAAGVGVELIDVINASITTSTLKHLSAFVVNISVAAGDLVGLIPRAGVGEILASAGSAWPGSTRSVACLCRNNSAVPSGRERARGSVDA